VVVESTPVKGFFAIPIFLLPALAGAHVGSPNVFFDGHAGPYPVRVFMRPPAVLPGTAQVDVRVDGATRVTLQPVLWEAGSKAAAEPVAATAVTGEPNLYNGVLWLFYGGSYGIHVHVEGNRGSGTAIVPLNSAALRQPNMSASLALMLIVLGVLLFAGLVWFVAVAAREGTVEPGSVPGARDCARAHLAAVVSVLLLAGASWAVQMRWQKMDREFRANALYRPTAVSATLSPRGDLRLLELTPPAENASVTSWDTLVADHGKLLHLFLIREPDVKVFAHLHPVRRDTQRFEGILPALPAGHYELYGEITHENGISETLVTNLVLPQPLGRPPQVPLSSDLTNDVFCQSTLTVATNAMQPVALDMDDSWHLGANTVDSRGLDPVECRLMGGLTMVFQSPGELVENRETLLRFAVFSPNREPARLQPYMGMAGHCVVRRSDGAVFTHLHPVGTISMAAQQLFVQKESGRNPAPAVWMTNNIVRGSSSPGPGNEVTFPYAFPRPGNYRLWVQVRTGGRVLTGTFGVTVKPAR
jgi:hypothetical protein